jgi:hypothetical protein
MSRMLADIQQTGFALLKGALPNPSSFADAYRAFDAVANLVEADELAEILLEKTAVDWTKKPDLLGYYAKAPMGFRNRSERQDKEKKSYFQYTPAYEAFVRTNYPRIMAKYPEIDWLFVNCDSLCRASEQVLKSVILEFDRHFPGLRTLLLRKGNPSPVILRLLRYEPGNQIETLPHYDKSAFTVHMHSDDSKADQFVIGPWCAGELSLADLNPVTRRANCDAVVFPGLFLDQMGYHEIRPTPHAALGSEDNRYRHVAVGFWLVPFMMTEHLSTNIPYKGAA